MSDQRRVLVKVMHMRPEARELPLPQYETTESAGMDLRACLDSGTDSVSLEPGGRALIPTGLAIALPPGTEAQVRPRSGLALRSGITTLNAPGTIDSDYRGEVGVILQNHGSEPFEVRHGDRIAQLVVAPVLRAQLELGESLDETQRGAGGFGSTGKS